MKKSAIIINGFAYLHDAIVNEECVTGIFLMTNVPQEYQNDTDEIWVESRFTGQFTSELIGLLHYLDKGFSIIIELKAEATKLYSTTQIEGDETIRRLHVESKLHCIGNIYVNGDLLQNTGNYVIKSKAA